MEQSSYQTEFLTNLGLEPSKLTAAQIDIVMQPEDAPENYAQDGEISGKQARQIWKAKMSATGFTPRQVVELERKIFG